MSTAVPASDTVLILRSCGPDMKSECEYANGFTWPESGPVECADWDPKPACGNGLHGLLWAQGNFGMLSQKHDAKFLAVEVMASDIVSLDNGEKVKFPRGNVVMCSAQWWKVIEYIKARAPKPAKLEAHNDQRRGHASATGDSGHASATGSYGHASATGSYGHACALNVNGGRAKAGENGLVAVAWWDESARRGRLAVGYVGEDGIKPNTWYGVTGGKLVEMPA